MDVTVTLAITLVHVRGVLVKRALVVLAILLYLCLYRPFHVMSRVYLVHTI